MEEPQVTVVMISWSPTPQRLAVMKRSLASVQRCTTMPHKLVVVDNGPDEQTRYLHTVDGIDIIRTKNTNIGIGRARNEGAYETETPYIAFVDSDLEFFPGWLSKCVGALKRLPTWPLIATAIRTSPMKKSKVGELGAGYQLFNRCGGGCIVIRRKDYEIIGPWATHSTPGGDYSDRVRAKSYAYIWHPDWKVRHLCKKASYNHRNRLINGEWIAPTKKGEVTK